MKPIESFLLLIKRITKMNESSKKEFPIFESIYGKHSMKVFFFLLRIFLYSLLESLSSFKIEGLKKTKKDSTFLDMESRKTYFSHPKMVNFADKLSPIFQHKSKISNLMSH
jgi:hypothetical protein